ncbi:MAG: biotin--[acetyl-CoA-carboxylase] ligase [Cyclobacteriaceae bacterium]
MGKKVIFLTECHSTSDELAALLKKEDVQEGTVILTDHQKNGKGQRGNVWLDEPGKNLLISLLVKPSYLLISSQYLLNVAIGLGILKCAGRYLDPSRLSLKWPNDLLVDDRKISGVLIENSLKGSRLENSIIGIGFNLNQRAFNLPSATSIFVESDRTVDRDEFAGTLLADLEFFLLKLRNGQTEGLLQSYHQNLYLIEEQGVFKDKEGEFSGRIQGIDSSGKLLVNRNGSVVSYGLKEIEFSR